MQHTNEGGLEECLGAAEALVANGDHLTIRQLVALLQRGGGGSCGHLILKVQSNIAKFLFDVAHDLTLSWKQEETEGSDFVLKGSKSCSKTHRCTTRMSSMDG